MGTSDPEPCPVGTYSNQTGLEASANCVTCDAGSYCQDPGIIEPTDHCTPGSVYI